MDGFLLGDRSGPISTLNPDAAEFVPQPWSPPYAAAADRLSITDEILYGWTRSDGHLRDPSSESAGSTFGVAPSPLDEQPRQLDPLAPAFVPSAAPTLISTPVAPGHVRGRPRERHSPIRRRGPRLTNRDWSFMPGRRNRRRRRDLMRRILYSDEGEVSIEEEKKQEKDWAEMEV